MRSVNPYIVGNPVRDQSSFYGRQDIFREVMQVLHQRDSHAIVLYGQRRIGKTSMLFQLEQRLAKDGEFTPIYFDLQDKASKSLTELLFELAQHISRITGYGTQKPSDFERTDHFRDTFLPGVVKKVAGSGLVLLFDEFDVLDSPVRTQASQAFFPYLRTWMENVQKMKFVFVIGRRPEELSIRNMAVFKDIQSTRVSFMSQKDTESVVRQSEQDKSLVWEADAVARVYDLTHGHPYFTQLLCSVVWESNHEDNEENPIATSDEIEKGVDQALKMGANAFSWLWGGLPPAERVIMSAMAEVKNDIITQEQLIESLNQSGVRLIARELEIAPETLIDWELLYRVDSGYRFSVPLLRRWVMANRPLRRVKDELDRLDPLADTLFQAGQGFYNANRLTDAEAQLRQALNINPNHLKARLLLGRVYLDQNKLPESVEALDAAYQYDEGASRADLLRSLLALAEQQTQDDTKQLEVCDRILAIQPDQPAARDKKFTIWTKRGDKAFEEGNLEQAAKAYETVSNQVGLERIQFIWRETRLKEIPVLVEEEKWEKIVEVCEPLLDQFPGDEVISGYLENARLQLKITRKYNEGLGALQSGMRDQARRLFTEIMSESPAFGRAALKLVEAMYGRVTISMSVPVGVTVLIFLNSFLWATVILLNVIPWYFGLIENILTNSYGSPRFLFTENFLIPSFIAIPTIAIVLNYLANRTIGIAYEVERRKYSYGKAVLAHLLFGMGLFYIAPESRRKWLYMIIALLIPAIVLTKMAYDFTGYMWWYRVISYEFEGGLRIQDIWMFFLILVVIGHVLSLIDVLVTCRQKQSKLSQPTISTTSQPIGWRNALLLLWPSSLVAVSWVIALIYELITTSDTLLAILLLILLLIVGFVPILLLARGDPQKFSWWKLVFIIPALNALLLFASYGSFTNMGNQFAPSSIIISAFVLPVGSLVTLIISRQKYGSRTFQTWLLFTMAMSSVTGLVAAMTIKGASDLNIFGVTISLIIAPIYFSVTEFKSFLVWKKIGLNISGILGVLIASLILFTDSSIELADISKFSYIVWPLLAGIIVSLLYKFNYEQIISTFRQRTS